MNIVEKGLKMAIVGRMKQTYPLSTATKIFEHKKTEFMQVVIEEDTYFDVRTNSEIFPFPPALSRKAKNEDFVLVDERGKRIFKLDVEFWAQANNGYYYKFKTTPETNKQLLADDIKLGRIFIPPVKE